jgi:protein gp37
MAAERSAIEWTEATWNPTSGCTKVSPGCDRCYAEAITRRFPQTFPTGFALTLRPNALDIPLGWRRPRMVFVNSMSDLFHTDVSESYLVEVFDVMRRAAHHTFQILTKRAERLARVAPRLHWSPNVWIGVSVESAPYAWRIDYLRKVPAAVRFVSAEPLLSSLPRTNLSGIDWLIAGGESQPGCRPADLNWFRDLRDQCRVSNVAFFLKQLGGHPCKRGGEEAVLDGRRWVQFPRPRPVVPVMLPSSTDAMRSEGRVQHLSDYRRQNRVGKEDTRSSSAEPADRRPHQRKRIAGDC